MTFEEMQRAIEQMLAVQREFQESQLRQQERESRQDSRFQEMQRTLEQLLAVQRNLQDSQLHQREELDRLLRITDRLVGYSITNESDHLNLEERMNRLEQRMRRVEGNGNQDHEPSS